MAKLIYTDGGTDHEFALDPGRAAYTVGRNPMCDLRINNPSISRKHAEIRLDAATGRYSVYDLNSSNGTYLNGKREHQAELKPGDEVMCGEFKLFFQTDDGGIPAAATGVGPPKPPPPPPDPPRHAKTLSAKPGDLFSSSSDLKNIVELQASTDTESTLKVSSDMFDAAFASDSSEMEPVKDETAPQTDAAVSTPGEGGDAEVARELKAAKAELKSLRMALQNESGRAAEASQEKARLAKEIKRLKDDFAAAEGAAQAPQERADGASARVEELEVELGKRDDRIAALEKDAGGAKLKTELAAAKKQVLAAKADAAKAAGERDKAKAAAKKNTAGDSEKKRLTADLRKRSSELDEAKVTAAESAERIKELEAEVTKLRSLEGELEVARSQIEELQTPSGDASGDADALAAKNAAMKAAFKDLSSELQELVRSNRELATELAALKDV